MPVSQSTIDRVRDSADIVELVSRYTKLEGRGQATKGLCPLHQDKATKSLSVSADSQVWHCFGCQEGGNVFHWLEKVEGLSFPAALRQLADEAGIQLDDSGRAPSRVQREHAREVAKDVAYYWDDLERGYVNQLQLVSACCLQAERYGRCNIEAADDSKWEQVWVWVQIGPALMSGIEASLDLIRKSRKADKVQAYQQLAPETQKRTRLGRLKHEEHIGNLIRILGEKNG